MDLYNDILKITVELYENLHFTRTDVQYMIKVLEKFIVTSYNLFLLKKLYENLENAISYEASEEIQKIFKKYKTHFLNVILKIKGYAFIRI